MLVPIPISLRRAILALAAAMALALGPGGARAYDLPLVNLGATSFLDGLVPGPGLYLNVYDQAYGARRFADKSGGRLPLPRQDIDVLAVLTQTYWVTPFKVGDGWLAFSAVLPVVPMITTDDGLGGAALSAQGGVGDLFLGIAWQGAPVMGPDGPRFAQRLEFDVIAPVGAYDPDVAINPGGNAWSLNPHWDATYFVTPETSVSTRIHWLYTYTNDDPTVAYGPAAGSMKPGQAVHANLSVEQKVRPDLWLGLNGYALKQYTDTRIDGADAPGRRERVFAIGPGALYAVDDRTALFANLYVEAGAENRSQGMRLNLRFAHRF
jgi:anthranilate 1,2-dioxygenase (deaminating, decarboxylating) large subunit